jgi:hypothetical protein
VAKEWFQLPNTLGIDQADQRTRGLPPSTAHEQKMVEMGHPFFFVGKCYRIGFDHH